MMITGSPGDYWAGQAKWQMDPGQAGNIQGHLGWEDITGVDGGTTTSCTAHFSKPYEGYLGLWSPLLPAHYLKTVSVADATTKLYAQKDLKSGVYSGPYIPATWTAGAEIDYKDDLQGAQFVIKNPNATTTCGCGSSFSA